MDATCQTCRYWVAYNQAEDLASRGECTLGPLPTITSKAKSYREIREAIITPFDWSCAGHEPRPRMADDAQICPA